MPVRMSHPEHGITYAVGSEVDWNRKHGWKVEPKVKESVDVVKPTEVTQITQARRGRPPKG